MATRKKRARRHLAYVDGLLVEDAAHPIDIEVTEMDIAKGRPDPCECAFAVAIMRITGAKRARVQASRVYYEKGGKYMRLQVPQGMRAQLELFDRTGKMGPGVYTIPVVSESHALGTNHDKTGKGSLQSPPLMRKRVKVNYTGENYEAS